MNAFILPMRPGRKLPRLDTYGGPLPAGWGWQVKLDDERGVYAGGALYNRHGEKIAAHKAAAFAAAVAEAARRFHGETLDLALLGYRSRFERPGPGGIGDGGEGGPRVCAVVILDLPDRGRQPWTERHASIVAATPEFDPLGAATVAAGCCYHLADHADGPALFRRTVGVAGLEGVIGRKPDAPYCAGDSPAMLKSRWKP